MGDLNLVPETLKNMSIHLCDSCYQMYPECFGNAVFTDNPKTDNIVSCSGYLLKEEIR